MYWESWADFMQMGRHGFYVWSCVLASVCLIGFEWVVLARAKRQALKKLQQLDRQQYATNMAAHKSHGVNNEST